MTLPIISVIQSPSIANSKNGYISSDLLVKVGPSGWLIPEAARAWNALVFFCMGFGLFLTYTYGGTYRSFTSQLGLFLSRYEPVSLARYLITPSSRRKRWLAAGEFGHSSTYWIKKRNADGSYPATAAVPGESNHGLGIAIDTARDSNPANGVSPADAVGINSDAELWRKFFEAVVRFGFSWELQSEPWHIRYVAGPFVPEAVLEIERLLVMLAAGALPVAPVEPPVVVVPVEPTPAPTPEPPAPAPVPAPTPTPTPAEPTNWTETLVLTLPTLRKTTTGQHVKALQALLVANGHNLAIDGGFGQQTEDHVKWFQAANALGADGIVGPKTWAKLLNVA
jgi:peptidoglycan hydrolase-like protein with peptidoglycan-binding domain